MKTSHLLAPLICGSITSASAFTVDFTQHLGDVTTFQTPALPPPGVVAQPVLTPIIVNVSGYGDVEFQVTFSTTSGPQISALTFSAEVGQEFSNNSNDTINSLNFSDQTAVQVTFKGDVPVDIDFDFVGVGVGENFSLGQIDDLNYTITFASDAGPIGIGDDPQAGLRSISFNAVPEPSSALLASLAALGLLRRRR